MTDEELLHLMKTWRGVMVDAMDMIEKHLERSSQLPVRFCGQGTKHGPHNWAPLGFKSFPPQWHCEGGADQTDNHPDNWVS